MYLSIILDVKIKQLFIFYQKKWHRYIIYIEYTQSIELNKKLYYSVTNDLFVLNNSCHYYFNIIDKIYFIQHNTIYVHIKSV